MNTHKILKRSWFFTSSLSVCGVIAYCVGVYNAEPLPSVSPEVLREYESEVAHLQDRINSMAENQMSDEDRYLVIAKNKYGLENLTIFAQNARYECPSSEHVGEKFRCDIREEIAVMYSTLNLLKKGNYGKTLHDVITFKHKGSRGAYLFSWVPTIKKKDTTSPIYKNSLSIAINVLGGNPEYEQYDYGQTYYCRHTTSPCGFHKRANKKGKLEMLGQLSLSESEVKELWVRPEKLSFHTFYKG